MNVKPKEGMNVALSEIMPGKITILIKGVINTAIQRVKNTISF